MTLSSQRACDCSHAHARLSRGALHGVDGELLAYEPKKIMTMPVSWGS